MRHTPVDCETTEGAGWWKHLGLSFEIQLLIGRTFFPKYIGCRDFEPTQQLLTWMVMHESVLFCNVTNMVKATVSVEGAVKHLISCSNV